MAKLIHSALIESVKKNPDLWSSSIWTNSAKKSLIFTDDYHIIVQGIDHRTFKDVGGALSFINGTLSLDAITGLTATTANEFRPIKIDKYGRVVSYGNAITPLVASNIKNLTFSNGATIPTTFVYDPDSAATTVTVTGGTNKINISNGTANFDVAITPSITGGTSTAPAAGKVISTITIGNNGAPSVASTTDVSALTLGGYTTNNSLSSITSSSTIGGAISTLINEIATVKGTATGAMTFKGTASALPTSNIVNGDTYKVIESNITTHATFTISATNSTTGVAVTPAIGDTIVAVAQGTSPETFKWAVIPSGDETFDTLEENTNGLSITVDGTTKAIHLTGKSFGSKLANTIFAAPNGAAGEPTFRTLVAADIPGLDASKIISGTIDAARLPKIGVSTLDGIVAVANGGTGKSSWTPGGLIYANATDAISQITNIAKPSSGTSTGLLQQNIDSTGAITYSYVNPSLVVTTSNTSTSNTASASSATAYINMLVGGNKKSGISISPGKGISVTYTNAGAITIANTLTSNVTSAFAVNSENKTISGTQYSTAKLTFTEGSTSTNWNIVGLGSTKVEYDSTNKYIKVTGTNTWRDVQVYKIVSSAQDGIIDGLLDTEAKSINTAPLKFSSNFSVNTNDEIDLAWAEIDSNGTITYSI